MEMIFIIATIILIVILTRILHGITAISNAFGRLEVLLSAISANLVAIRKQGEGETVPLPKEEVQTAAAAPTHAAKVQAESTMVAPAPLSMAAQGVPKPATEVTLPAQASAPKVETVPPPLPFAPLQHFTPPGVPSPVVPQPAQPEEPTKLEQWAHAAWDWLRVGEEWRPGWIPGEYAVAAVQLLRAAALLLLFGAAWFVRYGHEQGWFSPTGRVVAGFVLAAALVAAGSRLLRRQWRPLGLVLAGLGFALGEFIDWAGANLYEVLPASGAFAIAAALALGAGAMAWRHASLLLGLVALFAGYTAPWFFPEAVRGGDAALLAWLLLLAAEGAALALTRGWRCLPWITLVATVALSAPVFAPVRLDALGRGWSLVFVALFTVFAWAESLGHALRNRRAPFWFDLAAWAAATAAAAVAATCAVSPWPLFTNGLPALVLAVGSLALAYAFKTRDNGDRATLEWIFAVFSALALAFVCLSFNGTPRCALLCAAAVGFVLFAARRGSVIQACYAILAWMLWMCYVGTPASAAERIGRIGPAVASLWASGLLLRRMKTEASRFTSAFLWIAWAASLVWGTWEVNHAYPEFAPSIALYWGVHALATLVVGLLFQRRDVRGAALCLFAAAAGKFLFVDQAGAPTPERVAGFLGVGLLLLLGSAGYIRAASPRRGDAANDEPRKRGNDE